MSSMYFSSVSQWAMWPSPSLITALFSTLSTFYIGTKQLYLFNIPVFGEKVNFTKFVMLPEKFVDFVNTLMFNPIFFKIKNIFMP